MTQRYEELLSELREIVKKIEDNETSLDECITLYERGVVLVKECERLLETAEMKITRVSQE